MKRAESHDVIWRIQLSSGQFEHERSLANDWVSYYLCANTANSDKYKTLSAILGKIPTTRLQISSRVFQGFITLPLKVLHRQDVIWFFFYMELV